MPGMTLKQGNRVRFWRALDAYKIALNSPDFAGLARAGLIMHIELGGDGVPKSWKRFVRAAEREAQAKRSERT